MILQKKISRRKLKRKECEIFRFALDGEGDEKKILFISINEFYSLFCLALFCFVLEDDSTNRSLISFGPQKSLNSKQMKFDGKDSTE